MPRITIIIPAYNEAGNIRSLYDSVSKVIGTLSTYQWQLLFVDDGSEDDTWSSIEELSVCDPRVRGLRLSRNFGKEVALTAGAEAVKESDAVIFMDADLQHPPPVIRDLVQEWENGHQIVATRRLAIEYSWFREVGSRLFYRLLRRYSDLDIQPKATDFRLLDAQVLKELQGFEERTRSFRGLVDWMGFDKTFVNFEAPNRQSGASTFRAGDLFKLAINTITTFSLLPLRIAAYLGLLVIIGTVGVFGYMIITDFFFGQLFTPLAYFVVFNTFLFGVVLAALGMVALYIGHIHTEVVRRPLYIIRQRAGFECRKGVHEED